MAQEIIGTVGQAFAEKGFWYAMGFIVTSAGGLLGFGVRNEMAHRKKVDERFEKTHKRIDVVHKKLSDNAQHVAENYVDKGDLKILLDHIDSGFTSVRTEIRDIRNGKS